MTGPDLFARPRQLCLLAVEALGGLLGDLCGNFGLQQNIPEDTLFSCSQAAARFGGILQTAAAGFQSQQALIDQFLDNPLIFGIIRGQAFALRNHTLCQRFALDRRIVDDGLVDLRHSIVRRRQAGIRCFAGWRSATGGQDQQK